MDNIVNDDAGLKQIEKMYKNLTYFDQYGGSVILLIIITMIVILICAYCFVMIHASEIRDDWQNNKCKPLVMPFAGIVNAPSGTSMFDYTADNFSQCLYNIQTSVAGEALEPITFVTNALASVIKAIENQLNSVRAMFAKIRTFFQNITTELMGRIMNVMIPLQQIIISLKDFLSKVQGVMTAGLFTAMGSYYTLQALMGAIAEFIILILIAMAIIVTALWVVPLTWGAAGAMTAVFLSIAIPMAIIVTFMTDVLKVKPGVSIPKIKCFDKDTRIMLNNKSFVKIKDIHVGDVLLNNNTVTSVIKVTSKESIMYKLNDILVSDSHILFFENKWIKVAQHPNAIKQPYYNEKHLYCLNTTNKNILINDIIFTDWDDLYGNILTTFLSRNKLNSGNEIHTRLDCGFAPNTKVRLDNGKYKNINEINVGDVLENNIVVYGVVKLDGRNLKEFTVILEGSEIQMGSNGAFHFNGKREIAKAHKELYHLLTNSSFFYIGKHKFDDYNSCIDSTLEY